MGEKELKGSVEFITLEEMTRGLEAVDYWVADLQHTDVMSVLVSSRALLEAKFKTVPWQTHTHHQARTHPSDTIRYLPQ